MCERSGATAVIRASSRNANKTVPGNKNGGGKKKTPSKKTPSKKTPSKKTPGGKKK